MILSVLVIVCIFIGVLPISIRKMGLIATAITCVMVPLTFTVGHILLNKATLFLYSTKNSAINFAISKDEIIIILLYLIAVILHFVFFLRHSHKSYKDAENNGEH